MTAFDRMRDRCRQIAEWEPCLSDHVSCLVESISILERDFAELKKTSTDEVFIGVMENATIPVMESLIESLAAGIIRSD